MKELPSPEELEAIEELPAPEELDSLEPPTEEDKEMSYAETLGLKIGEGASLGATDILSGVVGAGVDLLTPESEVDKKLKEEGFKLPEESLLDSYRSARDYSKRLQEKSAEDNPKLSLAADVVGGIASGSALGKVAQGTGRLAKLAHTLPGATELKTGQGVLKTAGSLAKEGVKAGALTGLLKGEADLTKGEVKEALEETGKGALLGGIASPGLYGAGKTLIGASKLTGKAAKSLGRAVLGGDKFDIGRKAGKKGIDLFDEKQVSDELEKTANVIKKQIKKVFKDNDKFEMNKLLDEAGVKIRAGKPVKEALDEIIENGIVDVSDEKAIREFSDFLNTLVEKKSGKLRKLEASIEKGAAQKANKAVRAGGEVETRTEFDTNIEDIVPLPEKPGSVKGIEDKVSFSDEEGNKFYKKLLTQKAELEELVPFKIPDIENLSATELDKLINTLGKYTSQEANSSVVPVARRLEKSLKQLRADAGEGLLDLDVAERFRNLSKGLSVKERLGKNLFKGGEASEDALTSELKYLSQASQGKQLDKLNFLKKQLSDVSEESGKIVEESLEIPQMLGKLKKGDTEEGIKSLALTTGFGAISPTQVKLGQAVGKVQKKIGEEVIKSSDYIKKLTDSTFLNKVTNRLGSLKGPARDGYGTVLEKLNNPEVPNRTKNAIIMGLMQDPAFRKIIRKSENDE